MRKALKSLLILLALTTVVSTGCQNQTDVTETSGINTSEVSTNEISTNELKEGVSLTLATTTSVNDSGLLEYLAPYLKSEENIVLDVVAQGSGQAIQTAKDGNCDVLITHSPAAEKDFVDEGYGVDKQQFMYNYFVLVGPAADEAGIKDSSSAAESFKSIYDTFTSSPTSIFYSRDDKSGTDSKEKGIWKNTGLDIETFSADFYKKTGKGMLDTLIMADNTNGYTITDKATFLANVDKLPNLTILFEQAEDLKNTYSVMLIKPEKYSDLKHDDAKRFHDWLLKDSTQKLISEYGVAKYNEALFFIG